MAISVFDLFTVGIGPSSSHTVGPMIAANRFVEQLIENELLHRVARVTTTLYGSLGATGKGHATDEAVIAGLSGFAPQTCDVDELRSVVSDVRREKFLHLEGRQKIPFDEKLDLAFRTQCLRAHSNGMTCVALDEQQHVLLERTYFSIGGGFVVDGSDEDCLQLSEDNRLLPFPFRTGDELLSLCEETGESISGLMRRNELQWNSEPAVERDLLRLWAVMEQCVTKGVQAEGLLPGGMKVKRRAAGIRSQLENEARLKNDPMHQLDWVNLWAIAVNEENAAGGKVVTAPTNGAAGIIPAVLKYIHEFCLGRADASKHASATIQFLLTAGAIGIIVKENASISGAEVGCQGEVGSACSMAAAGLAEVLGGTPAQVENAAEIAMEHNLGLTCDPIGGLVQIPCIERNAMAAVKAINAARLALKGDGYHFVSLDKVVKTMRDTGRDMKKKYKETSRGGLAVNVIEC